jgi:hypothetical protein
MDFRGCVRTREEKPQISPLRCTPVPRHAGTGEMTNLLSHGPACIHWIVGNFRATTCHLACPGVPWDRSAAEWRDLRFLFPVPLYSS